MSKYKYRAIRAQQAQGHNVFVFAANPNDVLSFSEIDRVGRNEDGQLTGFQRHQIASHINEIRDYLSRDDALLPNAVILAFVEGISVIDNGDGTLDIEVDTSSGKPGYVVDGQQRLSALSGIKKPGFEVFVSALVCKDYNELRQQFVLINNTRPLPKTLIYELLPNVDGLPGRFTARKFAARIVDRLNHTHGSSLFGEIRQHTNPSGMLSDTAMQKVVMNSASDGAIRSFVQYEDREDRAFEFVNEFFAAVVSVFGPEWHGMSPRQSRLRHGAGLVAMGFVMDLLYSSDGAIQRHQFEHALEQLKPHTAWTSGQWKLSDGDERPWNGIQNTPVDIDLLARFLVNAQKRALRKLRKVANG
jgi:DGQHR domain-containing protein